MTIEELYVQHQKMIWKYCDCVSKHLRNKDLESIKEIADELFVKAAKTYDGSTKFTTYLWNSLRPLYRETAKLFHEKETHTDSIDQFADSRVPQYSMIYEEAEKELNSLDLKFLAFVMSLERPDLINIGYPSRDIPKMFNEKNPTITYTYAREVWRSVRKWFNNKEHFSCSIS